METVSVFLSLLWASGFTGALAQCPNKDPDLFITAPKTMEALTGSCVMIPCSFRTKPDQTISSGTIYGVWIKSDSRFYLNPNNVIYNSSKTVNIYPMNITGNLRQRNCTTLFSDLKATDTDRYYFRIENGALRRTAVCDPVQINVRDAPGGPTLDISGDLREDVSVTITCSASTPCPHLPPKLTWNLQAEPDNHREENTDGTFTTKIQETITLSDKHDGLTINCSASYPVTGGIKTEKALQTLTVSYAPKDTSASISPSAVVSAGSWVNLSCSSRARPPVSSFTWFQISSDGAKTNVSKGAFYTFNARGGGVYYCVASNGLGAQPSQQLHLTVGDAPGSPTLTISDDLREDVSVTITCSASTPCPHLPPKLTWNLQAEPDNHREENTDGTFTTKIQKTITVSHKHDGLTISCSASYPVTGGIKAAQTLVTLSVSYAPKDTSASISPSAVVSAGTWVNLSCSSRARPPVSSFTWFQISSDGAKANVSKGALYTFNATGGGVYYCVASNGLGAQASPQLHLTVGGHEASQLDVVHVTLKTILGLMVLVSIGIVCDRCLRPRSFNNQLEDTAAGDYVNIVSMRRRGSPFI
ncbi:B-cell receptor CD22-like [Betta splendens]|uniref:B-cell receptor CD22-like n=1 Tax=Betta splendens TaxID=158456 RepID=A0A6P7L3S3_BETSP|nr:B-cell receptor CD22-like [Betta splendens]